MVEQLRQTSTRALSNRQHVVGNRYRGAGPRRLGRTYSALLGWPIGHEEPGTAILAAPQGSIYIVFQQATNYQAPVWPPVAGEQRPMMHFDFQVGDLDSAVALGATLASHQPEENVSGALL